MSNVRCGQHRWDYFGADNNRDRSSRSAASNPYLAPSPLGSADFPLRTRRNTQPDPAWSAVPSPPPLFPVLLPIVLIFSTSNSSLPGAHPSTLTAGFWRGTPPPGTSY